MQDIDTEWLEQSIMGALMERHLLSVLAELYFEQHFSGGELLWDVLGLCCNRTQQTLTWTRNAATQRSNAYYGASVQQCVL